MFASAGYAHTTRLVHADCPHKLVRRVRQRHTQFQSRATYFALRLNIYDDVTRRREQSTMQSTMDDDDFWSAIETPDKRKCLVEELQSAK